MFKTSETVYENVQFINPPIEKKAEPNFAQIH